MRSKLVPVISAIIVATMLIAPALLWPAPALADSWSKLGSGGMESSYNPVQIQPDCTAVFNSKLYVGTDGGESSGSKCEIWRYDGGTAWTRVNTPGFGDPENHLVEAMTVFKGKLYAGTWNNNGCQVWRTDGTGAAPYHWTKVSSSGNIGGSHNTGVTSMSAGPTALYVGTENTYGCQVWSYNGSAWTQVIGGGAGTRGPGFGDTFNVNVSSLAWLGGTLYAGTYNYSTGCEVWTVGAAPTQKGTNGFGNPNNTKVSSMKSIGALLYLGTYNSNSGCQVRSYNGTIFSTITVNGMGDSHNYEATSMESFGSPTPLLHVGTYNGTSGCKVYRFNGSWSLLNSAGFGDSNNYVASSLAVFNSKLYAGASNGFGCRIYASSSVSSLPYTWNNVNAQGFTSNSNYGAASSAVFKGDLYVGTGSDRGCGVMKYSGGSWSRVNTDGFGNRHNSTAACMAASASYLYVGTSNGDTGCEVWRYDGSTWKQVNHDGFGDAHTDRAMSMVFFNSKLYAGVQNYSAKCGVWRYDGPNPANWTKVNVNGFGQPAADENIGVRSMCVFNSKLYAATDSSNKPCQVWRYDGPNPVNWTQVNVDGFGETYATSAEGMAVYGGKLYAATFDRSTSKGCRVWRYSGSGTGWTAINAPGFDDTANAWTGPLVVFSGRLYAVAFSQDSGGEVWEYDGGTAWKQANYGGFGTLSNHDIVSLVTDGARLYAGTTNYDTGCEVWATGGPPTSWYLPEGSTAWGYSAYVTVENPNATAVHADITYMTGNGPVAGGTVVMPPNSQATINPADKLGAQDFSTKVTCKEGKNIAVDRTMQWTGQGAASPEAHSSVGVNYPARTWFLAEGSSAWGFECWLLIQNPNAAEAHCTVTYMKEGAPPVNVIKTVPANSRKSFNIADDIGSADASIRVVGDIPVIPERAMYRNNRREGHDSIGTTVPATDYYLAEGSSAWGFMTYVLVQNPNSSDTTVDVTYMTASGAKPQARFTLAANSRKTIRVNDVLPNTDFSTRVHGSRPIIAERAMYWDNGTGEACHDSIGLDQAHTTFYMPDGETSNGRETWTLVQNPNSNSVSVEISYLTPTGTGDKYFTVLIPANSRKTFNMKDKIPNGRAAIRVISKTTGKRIMVERAMYWNNRGAGTDTIGGYSD